MVLTKICVYLYNNIGKHLKLKIMKTTKNYPGNYTITTKDVTYIAQVREGGKEWDLFTTFYNIALERTDKEWCNTFGSLKAIKGAIEAEA